MTLERRIASFFGLDDETWLRHANPWSVWSRVFTMPLFVAAFWSRAWIGWWALPLVVLVSVWIFVNPRVFPKPESTDRWDSKSVLGERVWSERDTREIPERHRTVPMILTVVAAAGGVLVVWGVYTLEIWPTALGVAVVYLGKLWFLDRMVWLFEDVKDAPEYKDWLY